jgi:hypothetical protein
MSEPSEYETLFLTSLSAVGFERVDHSRTETQFRVLGRVQRESMPVWRTVCERLNLLAGKGWTVDISQQYFVPEPLAKMVLGGNEPADGTHLRMAWRVIIAAKENLDVQLAAVSEHLSKVSPTRNELMTVQLMAPPNRNSLVRGKGAQPMNTALVGPALLNRGSS